MHENFNKVIYNQYHPKSSITYGKIYWKKVINFT